MPDTETNDAFRTVEAQTRGVYERNAARFDAERAKSLFEKPCLDRFLELLPDGRTVLDAGCGTGEPIASYLIDCGMQLTGIDIARPMLDIAAPRFPGHDWIHADMRDFDLSTSFAGIIAWHSFFHLTPEDQPRALSRFAAHLQPQGVLLLTVGPEAGEVLGQVAGERVYHGSLSPAGYREALAANGMQVVEFTPNDPKVDFATVLYARKDG